MDEWSETAHRLFEHSKYRHDCHKIANEDHKNNKSTHAEGLKYEKVKSILDVKPFDNTDIKAALTLQIQSVRAEGTMNVQR
jgi:hypothetical protein